MKKILAMLLGLLVFASASEAAPHPRLKKVVLRTIEYVVYSAPAITAYLAMKGGLDCRHKNGVEPCTAHYGEFRPTEGARFAVSLTFTGLSMSGHKSGFKEWFAPAVGISAFNAYWWRHEERINEPDAKQKK